MTRRNSKRRRSRRITLIYLTVIIVLSGIAFTYQQADKYLQRQLTRFKLDNIHITGNHILSRQDILDLCGLPPGKKSLMHVNPITVARQLRQSPFVKNASVVRSLPATLRIRIEERKPVAFIYGRGLNLIDDQGYLLPVPQKERRWNLPLISGIKESLGMLGERTTSAKALKGVEILSYLHFMHSPLYELVSEINMKKWRRPILRLTRGGAVVKISPDNYQENLFILDGYVTKYLNWSELATIEYIDIRFKDQLIVKEKRG